MPPSKSTVTGNPKPESKPDGQIGTRPYWETQSHGFGETGFGKLGFGEPRWATATTKAIRPEVGRIRNKVTRIRSMANLHALTVVEGKPETPIQMPPDYLDNATGIQARRVQTLIAVRSKLTEFNAKRVKRKGKPDESPFTEIKYSEKKVGKKGARTRLFTKCQGYENIPPLPPSGGLSEEELAKLRDRSIPRDSGDSEPKWVRIH